jgi:hypothetical protein
MMRLFSIIILSVAAASQCQLVDRDSPEAVREEVNRIYNETLDAMTYKLPSGITAVTWLPPDESVRGQVQCLGTTAVPALDYLLRSNERSFGHLLAIQMLGWIGGAEIVPPLKWALLRPGDFLITKTAALDSLNAAPPELALPAVQQALRSEKNPHVIEKATEMVARLKNSVKNQSGDDQSGDRRDVH